MPLFVKFCGLRRGRDVEAAVSLRPDAVGFVFWPRSVRAVQPADVAAWTRGMPAGMERVGVFVDEEPDTIRRIMDSAGLTIAQLHGSETAAFGHKLGRRFWKAMAIVKTDDDTPGHGAEAVLLDNSRPDQPGGTGEPGDWERAAQFVRGFPGNVILAGGLTPANVGEAVRHVRPWGVDVSSGIESAPGVKDASRMKEFIEQCRAY